MSYSGCGTLLGVLFGSDTITTYNTVSGTHISSHSIPKPIAGTIWTHGECLRFTTVESGSISIWEVSFTSSDAPTEICSLSAPDNFSPKSLVFFPTLSRLAFILEGRVLVWDDQHQKTLLDSEDVKYPTKMSFSPDGCFLMCGTEGPEFHLWKESPDGYLPYQTLVSSARFASLAISPDGGSAISFGGPILQLWHTTNHPTSLPTISTQDSQYTKELLMEFSPSELLLAVAQRLSNTATVLNVKSGNPLLVIDTSTKICGLRITETTIIVVGDGKIVTWDLPAGDGVLNAKRNIADSIQTTMFEYSEANGHLFASISPDLSCIAFGSIMCSEEDLCLYDMHTGKKLAVTRSGGWRPGFTLGGHEVWCATDDDIAAWWTIVEDGSNVTKLEHLKNVEELLEGTPWQPLHGCQVTDDGWILSSSGKLLLWLPHHWRSMETGRRWSGKFLALQSSELPEAVILELEV